MSVADGDQPFDSANNDDKELVALGYNPSFKREFTNLATVISYKIQKDPVMTISPRSVLRLVLWYEIIGRGRIHILTL
jgi:hypothetical protein